MNILCVEYLHQFPWSSVNLEFSWRMMKCNGKSVSLAGCAKRFFLSMILVFAAEAVAAGASISSCWECLAVDGAICVRAVEQCVTHHSSFPECIVSLAGGACGAAAQKCIGVCTGMFV